MRRRDFLLLIAGSTAWPLQLRAQQPRMPVIGFLRNSTAGGSVSIVAGFRLGLQETGYVDGENVKIDYRLGEGRSDRMPSLAADLVRAKVAVILASSAEAARAAKSATSTIPIVFVTASDPVEVGLVASLNRPGGNATGVTYLTSALGAKRLELIKQMVPAAKSIAVLMHRNQPTEAFMRDIQAGSATLGVQLLVSAVTSAQEIDSAFASFTAQRAGALVVAGHPLFTAQRAQIAAQAARHSLPAIYTAREFVQAGGLMAWGASLVDQYRVAGVYAGRILKGAKPAELPVQQPTKFELIINLKTVKALGLTVPRSLLVEAEAIE